MFDDNRTTLYLWLGFLIFLLWIVDSIKEYNIKELELDKYKFEVCLKKEGFSYYAGDIYNNSIKGCVKNNVNSKDESK